MEWMGLILVCKLSLRNSLRLCSLFNFYYNKIAQGGMHIGRVIKTTCQNPYLMWFEV